MKTFNLIFIILFLIFAGLQYNDPDPYIWVPIYLYAAFLCYKAYRKTYTPALYYFGIAVYVVYALYLLLDDTGVLSWATDYGAENIARTMKAEKPWIEETREFFGLVILIAVLLANMVWLNKQAKNKVSY